MQLNLPTHEPSPRHDRAFTLVEMLLVLMILSLLAAIVYPRIIGRNDQARIDATKVQIKGIENALELFEADNGYFPKGHDGLQELVTRSPNAQNWHGPYLAHLPKDSWGSDYIYTYPGKHHSNSFDLMSPGKDRQADTEDDLTNWQDGKSTATSASK